jgi:hypothetical protein
VIDPPEGLLDLHRAADSDAEHDPDDSDAADDAVSA